ncbi:MAG: hypothetical protein K2P94_16805 [Rhodospirillaceae bacterium]|nr:hypothetical protein [Rhodospirillaceae bacterium]
MQFRLKDLTLGLRQGDIPIPLANVHYFWGQMGAGKTSIARLIDYCLGGNIELTPALQNEFVGAKLSISLRDADIEIERQRDASQVFASWGNGDDATQVILPARDAAGEKIPGTGVENLSDLIFWLSGVKAPRVRRSKVKHDSGSGRLSIRDLLWYCYLDQDEIDSSFFHLDENAHPFKRLKSRDVLRFVIGFHDERVAEIEAELDQLRGERQATEASVESLGAALRDVGVGSEIEIFGRAEILEAKAADIQGEIVVARRPDAQRPTAHAVDGLRAEALRLGKLIAEIDAALDDLRTAKDRDQRHLNELETLFIKVNRSVSARAILSNVAFHSCPRCTQLLPDRAPGDCSVCGQTEYADRTAEADVSIIERDAKTRIAELRDIIVRHDKAREKLSRDRDALMGEKARIERERNELSVSYDSAYLANMVTKERERAALLQEAANLKSLMRLPQTLDRQRERIGIIQGQEEKLRAALKEARAAAESDATNLTLLKDYFLDCLVRSGIPGITRSDKVEISATTFYPEILGPTAEDPTVTSFATISSGGKKTLFKTCFAIAVHRLAAGIKAPLPDVLIIDSPMKNISERENRAQFKGFYNMVYELKAGELSDHQIILIDKEFAPPLKELGVDVVSRHMRPDDNKNPPLIPTYRGK